ncbi:unnamed protein product [Acanthoscelides obtectus]|uniref:Uncharacterized protein n=1 Tax=Acanthoscelides obtectus TaxID=200917 RepID=A0A9P0P9L2_ACAOB|nr:unnamed protein product [Acanthoscelides obtectus]CAK1660909.1 hypothetical protein AOBTE_LOCUS22327 [Acanthoscelides obtectus]
MSSRTKLIMKLSNQQASHSCVDIVEYEVGKDGILSPIHAQPSKFPADSNDSASINNDNSTSFNHLEVPTGLKDASISTDFDLQTDLNDAISMNNELDNPEILGTEQDEDNTNNTITNNSEDDDGAADDLDVSYIPEENDSDSSNSANEDNSNYNEERNDPDTSLNTTRTRSEEKIRSALPRAEPKKDLCDVCEAYKTKNLSEDKYNLHQTSKLEARQSKEKDKSTSDVTVNVYPMDLQSVLLASKSTVAAMYYKTKLVVHNFTIYHLKSNEGFCFLWNESEGALTANEFSSIISVFVEQEIRKNEGLREMIFFSDGCMGQNHNSTSANAFVNLAAQHKIVLIQKYLFKGHTQMEVDSVHATIEIQIRNRKINLPADYAYYCQKARSSPSPYNVKYLTHSFFKKMEL